MRHAASIHRSRRLQTMLEALRDGLWHTTKDLQETTGGCAIGTTVSELRAASYEVECKFQHVTENGSKIYSYRLVP